jgi:hypothetical protein
MLHVIDEPCHHHLSLYPSLILHRPLIYTKRESVYPPELAADILVQGHGYDFTTTND